MKLKFDFEKIFTLVFFMVCGMVLSSCIFSDCDNGQEKKNVFLISASINNPVTRNAFPSSIGFPPDSRVKAMLEDMCTYGMKKGNGSDYVFSFMNFMPEKDRSYVMKITVLNPDDKEILHGNVCFKVTDDTMCVNVPGVVFMSPVENQGHGNVKLKIIHPKGSSVELSNPLFAVEPLDETTSVVKGTGISCGAHDVYILIKIASSEIYKIKEKIYIYDGCITDRWIVSGSDELNLSMVSRNEFYVMGKGSTSAVFNGSSYTDSEGKEVSNGSIRHPFRSVQDAIEMIKIINESSEVEREFTIYCDGTFEPVNDENYCGKVVHLTRTDSEIGAGNPNEFKKLNVKIIGIGNDKTVFDGMNISGSDSPVVDVDRLSSVYMKNIKICRGDTTGYGGGIVNRGKLTLDSCEVSDNKAVYLEPYPNQQRSGGGIYNCGSDLVLKDSVVKDNRCKNLGSAIFCSGTSATVELDGCIFIGNSSSQKNDSIVIMESLTLKGNVEFGSGESILFKNKIEIIAPSRLDGIEQVKVALDGGMYVEGDKILWGNTEDNCTKFKFEATTWAINSDGDLVSLRVVLSSLGDSCPISGYYWVSTAEDLNKIRGWVEESDNGLSEVDFMMLNDIALEGSDFIPIGSSEKKAFRGRFNGNKKTISGLEIKVSNGAFFRYAGKGAVISNLTLKGSSTAAGFVYSTNDCEIDSCVNEMTVTANPFNTIGGIIGLAENTKITNCINRGTVSNSCYRVGGIVGKADKNCTIDRVVNRGNVTNSYEEDDAYVGGIAGSVSCNITNSCNYGTVTGKNYAGGIAGFVYAYSNMGIKNCYNAGQVYSPYYSAGIVAELHHEGVNNYTVVNCYNGGDIYYSSGIQTVGDVHTNQTSKSGIVIKNNYAIKNLKYKGWAINPISPVEVQSYSQIRNPEVYDRQTLVVDKDTFPASTGNLVDLLNEWVDENNAELKLYSRWVEVTDGTVKRCRFEWE